MNGHTQGPWLVDTGHPRRTTIVARTGDDRPGAARFIEIAEVLSARDLRLIAAAPVMFVALQAAAIALDMNLRSGDPATLASVREAIRQVTGEAIP